MLAGRGGNEWECGIRAGVLPCLHPRILPDTGICCLGPRWGTPTLFRALSPFLTYPSWHRGSPTSIHPRLPRAHLTHAKGTPWRPESYIAGGMASCSM